jgi:hypothetical protein
MLTGATTLPHLCDRKWYRQRVLHFRENHFYKGVALNKLAFKVKLSYFYRMPP